MSNYTVRVIVDGGDAQKSNTSVKQGTGKKTEIKKIDKLKANKNFNKIALAGSVLGGVSVLNGLVGEFTEKRVQQKKNEIGLRVAAYGLAVMVSPLAVVGIVAVEGVNAFKYYNKVQKENINSDYIRQISGNTLTSGNRWRGVNR